MRRFGSVALGVIVFSVAALGGGVVSNAYADYSTGTIWWQNVSDTGCADCTQSYSVQTYTVATGYGSPKAVGFIAGTRGCGGGSTWFSPYDSEGGEVSVGGTLYWYQNVDNWEHNKNGCGTLDYRFAWSHQ